MIRHIWVGGGLLALAACSPQPNGTADPATTGNVTVQALERIDTARGPSCMSDAECGPDENCECTGTSNGNCEEPGICLPRPGAMSAPPANAAAPAVNSCRSMSNLSFIPAGHHPVSARWELDAQGRINDMVCIQPTRGKQIRVLRWLDAPLPADYYTLRMETGTDTTFRGCRTWTSWQGQNQCSASWDLHVMQRNPEPEPDDP